MMDLEDATTDEIFQELKKRNHTVVLCCARVLDADRIEIYQQSSGSWALLYGMIFELPSEMEEFALQWRSGRMNDLGFPDREQAMRLYTRLAVEQADVLDASAVDAGEASGVVLQSQLPQPLQGSLVGEALCKLPPLRAMELLGYVLGTANGIAVADRLRLSESDSIPKAIDKALRGIELGLRTVAAARDLEPHEALDRTTPGDLFRIGATLDDTLRERPPSSRDDEDSDDESPDDAETE